MSWNWTYSKIVNGFMLITYKFLLKGPTTISSLWEVIQHSCDVLVWLFTIHTFHHVCIILYYNPSRYIYNIGNKKGRKQHIVSDSWHVLL